MSANQELRDLAAELTSIADSRDRCRDADTETIKEAAKHLLKASRHICGGGYYNCRGGEKCTSDHK